MVCEFEVILCSTTSTDGFLSKKFSVGVTLSLITLSTKQKIK